MSRCTRCHERQDGRGPNGAPSFHDFDTLFGIEAVSDHIDETTASGPAATNDGMPDGKPKSKPRRASDARRIGRLWHAGASVLAALSAPAYADHGHHQAEPAAQSLTASIGAIAASYRSRFYEGHYQGGSLGVAWSRGRFEVAARGIAYQIDRNGKTYRGFGDTKVHGAARLFERGGFHAGAHLMVMAPTGDAVSGLGMGHWMLMPAAWASYAQRVVTVNGSLGYARGIGGEDVHAEHGGGGWPLVEPMSFSEITFDAMAMVPVARSLAIGAHVLGAMPLDDDETRVIGGARISWRAGRIETLAEAQAGIAGDPVRFRGLVSTAMTF